MKILNNNEFKNMRFNELKERINDLKEKTFIIEDGYLLTVRIATGKDIIKIIEDTYYTNCCIFNLCFQNEYKIIITIE